MDSNWTKWLVVILFIFFTLIASLFFWFWQNRLQNYQEKIAITKQWVKKKESNLIEQENRIYLAKSNLSIDIERNEVIKKNLQKEEERLNKISNNLLEKELIVTEQSKKIFQKEQKLENATEELKQKEEDINDSKEKIEKKLWEAAQMKKEEARELLFSQLKEEIREKLDKHSQREIKRCQENIKAKTVKIICSSLENYSSELVFNKTVNRLEADNRQTIGRIIGKDGKNINSFRKITGAEIIIDHDQKDKLVIEVSSFNSLRREIATRTLACLIDKKRITPLQIESTFQEISKNVDQIIIQSGEEVLEDLEITNVHPEMVKYLGKLKFRTSYGQNVLEHCYEVAKLAGSIAAELNLDVILARRAGLFHDIGKALEDDGSSHVTSGIALAKQYEEDSVVINAIASHHRDFPTDNLYSLIVSAADTLSAARPGARGQQLETYIIRMESLEKLSNELPGVEKIYAFQAGREIWVLVDAKKITDYQLLETSEFIKNKIREQIAIPGEVTISVLRETKITQKFNTLVNRKEAK